MLALAITITAHWGSLAPSWSLELVLAGAVGVISGMCSGFCGVSPGGPLVVLSTLVLGAGQHLAQGVSLAAQIPPTGLSGIKRYRTEGARCPLGWVFWLGAGFLLGGAAGAIGAAHVSGLVLRWSYVGYLGVLNGLLIFRTAAPRTASDNSNSDRGRRTGGPALSAVGILAGLSSGYLGIGGGLAVVAGLSAGLKIPQHQAQLVSLVLSIIPATIPAAYIYWREGFLPSWPVLIVVIGGLWLGTDLGARLALRLSGTTLHRVLIVMVGAMTVYMTWRALAPAPQP